MADIPFLVDFTVSMTAVILPIVVIVRLLAADDIPVDELFILPIAAVDEPMPPEEMSPPRWHPERIRAPHRASEPVASTVWRARAQ